MVTPQLSQPGLSGIFGCKGRVLLSRGLHRWEMTVGRCLQRFPGPSPPLHQPSPTPGPTAAARTPQYPPRCSGVRLTRSPTVSRSSRTFSSRSRFLSVSVSTISSAPRAASTCRHTHVSPAWRCSRPTVGHPAGCGTRLVTTAPSQGCGFASAAGPSSEQRPCRETTQTSAGSSPASDLRTGTQRAALAPGWSPAPWLRHRAEQFHSTQPGGAAGALRTPGPAPLTQGHGAHRTGSVRVGLNVSAETPAPCGLTCSFSSSTVFSACFSSSCSFSLCWRRDSSSVFFFSICF